MIARISTMTIEQRRAFNEYYAKCLSGELGFTLYQAAPVFNSYGLRFDIDYLRTIGSMVIFFPLEIMADYADQITNSTVMKDPGKCYMDRYQELTPSDVMRMNATTIGNMAFVLLHSENEKDKEIAEKVLMQIHAVETLNQQMLEGTI
jgi:hypothetical protein